MNELVSKLMDGAYDVHLHAAPGLTARRNSIIEIAEEARSYGMRGIVFKDHQFSTAPIACLMKGVVPELNVIGGVVLSSTLGGINPRAVEATFKLGGKVVWMFSLESAWIMKQINSPGFGGRELYRKVGVKLDSPGYTIFKSPDNKTLTNETKEIVNLCKEYDAVLETSHLSVEEGFAIVKEALNQGHKKVVVTHANAEVTPYSADDHLQLAGLGAYIMYCMNIYMTRLAECGEPLTNLVKLIKKIGARKIVLGTDFGIPSLPSPVEGMRLMITGLLDLGITPEEIEVMVRNNSKQLYDC
jgi:hypothetical protein